MRHCVIQPEVPGQDCKFRQNYIKVLRLISRQALPETSFLLFSGNHFPEKDPGKFTMTECSRYHELAGSLI